MLSTEIPRAGASPPRRQEDKLFTTQQAATIATVKSTAQPHPPRRTLQAWASSFLTSALVSCISVGFSSGGAPAKESCGAGAALVAGAGGSSSRPQDTQTSSVGYTGCPQYGQLALDILRPIACTHFDCVLVLPAGSHSILFRHAKRHQNTLAQWSNTADLSLPPSLTSRPSGPQSKE